jgi:sugar O-acyltransferase (sialic acid O-acetyltransferase NeuD family)
MVPAAARPHAMAGSGDIHVAGTGSFALEVVEYARDAGFEVAGLIELQNPARVGTEIHGLPVRSGDDPPAGGAAAVVGAGGDRLAHWALLAPHGWRAASVVHPAAHVAPSARVGDGCVVAPGVVVGAASELGDHVLVGRGALVGHHTVLEAGVVLNPGANVAGHVRLGGGATVGMGALVADHLEVGAGAVVAAGAAVVRSVPAGVRVQGVPARVYEEGGG